MGWWDGRGLMVGRPDQRVSRTLRVSDRSLIDSLSKLPFQFFNSLPPRIRMYEQTVK